jgi:gamma-glutamylcyclotransferase (GGCT)/AIG2-like uncharacterized protein YtfP
VNVFVYGTLKRGFPNHGVLEGARFIGPAFTVGKFHMRCCGFPIVFKGQETAQVTGELYYVPSPAIMHKLDRLEGVPQMYLRETVEVVCGDNTVDAEIYIGNDANWNRSRLPAVPMNTQLQYVWDGAVREHNLRSRTSGEQHV